MHLAAESGSHECCELLLHHNLDLDIQATELHKSITPIICAIRQRNESIVKFLIQRGCSLNPRPFDTHTVLNEAIAHDLELCTVEAILVGGASLSAVDAHMACPLWHAIDRGNPHVIKLLLQCNAEHAICSCCPLGQHRMYSGVLRTSVDFSCCPLVHALHSDNLEFVSWLVAAYTQDCAKTLFHAIQLVHPIDVGYHEMMDGPPWALAPDLATPLSATGWLSVMPLACRPQSLLRQCRRAVRKHLGQGHIVIKKISLLNLPPLLHNYLMFSDLEPPDEAKK